MKKSVGALLLALMILASSAWAADSYDLNDFEKEPSQGIVVGEKDEVRFEMFNATHTIIFDAIKDVGFRFSGYAYLDDAFRINGFATKKWSSHIDVNRDNVSDLIVAFYDSEYDADANKTYATVIFKTENNAITSQATSVPAGSGVIKEESYSRYLTAIGAIAFILVLVIIARRGSKNKKAVDVPEKSDIEESLE